LGWPMPNIPTQNVNVATAPKQTIVATKWASPYVSGARLWLATGDAVGTRLRSFSLDSAALTPGPIVDVNPLSSSARGDIAGAVYEKTDTAESLGRIFVATAEGADVTVRAFDIAGDNATLVRSVSLGALGPILRRGARDGQVAIAAGGDRVAVIWATSRALGRDEPLGGYAVLACAR
jgi:hypothetical protein